MEKILSSFDTHTKGFSANKLTAFTLIAMVVVFDINYIRHCYSSGDYSNQNYWLLIHLLAAAFFMGLIKWAELMQLRNGNNNNETKNDEQA
jgi:hypothetical protein